MSWIAHALLPACLGAALAAGALAGKKLPYIPWVDPAEPLVEGEPVVWRGDQRHASRLPRRPGEATHLYRIQDFRWNYTLETQGEFADHWRPHFGEAVVDTSRIRRISLLWYPFAPEIVAGHTSLLVEFEPGAITPGDAALGRAALGPPPTGIVVSLEARMKQGEKYGFKDGALGRFGVVYSVSTWRNYVQRCIEVYQGALWRWPLALTAAEAPVYGRAILDHGLAPHRDETYWLTHNSCSTAVMDMIIEGLRSQQAVRADQARAADLQALVEANEATKGVDVGELFEAVALWTAEQARRTITLERTRRLLGIHRENIKRTGGPMDLLFNPLMCFPAKLPGVLHRRRLIRSEEPEEILEYHEPATGAATGLENTADPGFAGLAGS